MTRIASDYESHPCFPYLDDQSRKLTALIYATETAMPRLTWDRFYRDSHRNIILFSMNISLGENIIESRFIHGKLTISPATRSWKYYDDAYKLTYKNFADGLCIVGNLPDEPQRSELMESSSYEILKAYLWYNKKNERGIKFGLLDAGRYHLLDCLVCLKFTPLEIRELLCNFPLRSWVKPLYLEIFKYFTENYPDVVEEICRKPYLIKERVGKNKHERHKYYGDRDGIKKYYPKRRLLWGLLSDGKSGRRPDLGLLEDCVTSPKHILTILEHPDPASLVDITDKKIIMSILDQDSSGSLTKSAKR